MSLPPHPPAAATPLATTVTAVAERTAELLRSGGDPATRIPGAEWTVAEAAAHLAMANALMADLAAGRERPYGDGTPGSLAAANAASLAAFPERDPHVLADGIVRHAKAFTDQAALRPADQPTLTPLGPMDMATLGSYLLTHMLGHGYDIARALRRPHMLDRDRVALTLPFLTLAMPRVVDERAAAGVSACFALRLWGGAKVVVTFTDGVVAVGDTAPRRVDCTILIEPVAFFLLALGRLSTPSAVLRGKVLAFGPKPWLAPTFPTLFTAP